MGGIKARWGFTYNTERVSMDPADLIPSALQPGTGRTLQHRAELHRLARVTLSHTALPRSLQSSPSSHLHAHTSSQPCLLEKAPGREAQPRAIQQGNQGAKWLPKLRLLPFPEDTETPE